MGLILFWLMLIFLPASAMLEFAAGAGALGAAVTYTAPRAIDELQKAISSGAQREEDRKRAIALLETDENIEELRAAGKNLLRMMSGRELKEPLSQEARDARYALRELKIFLDRWGETIKWAGGTALLGSAGTSLVAKGIAQSKELSALFGLLGLVVGIGHFPALLEEYQHHTNLKKQIQLCHDANEETRQEIIELNASLGKIKYYHAVNADRSTGLKKVLKKVMSREDNDKKVVENRYSARINALIQRAQGYRDSIFLLEQNKEKAMAKIIVGSVSCALSFGITCALLYNALTQILAKE